MIFFYTPNDSQTESHPYGGRTLCWDTVRPAPICLNFFMCVIDQACSVMRAGYWPVFSHLDRTSLVNKGFITRTKRALFLAEPTRKIPSGQDEPIQPAWLANQNVGSPSSCPLADTAIQYWTIIIWLIFTMGHFEAENEWQWVSLLSKCTMVLRNQSLLLLPPTKLHRELGKN